MICTIHDLEYELKPSSALDFQWLSRVNLNRSNVCCSSTLGETAPPCNSPPNQATSRPSTFPSKTFLMIIKEHLGS